MLYKLKNFIEQRGLVIYRSRAPERKGINLNIGCGNYEINGFINLDYYTKHYYNGGWNSAKRVYYNMRGDNLPFANESVNSIYCSHVIEHIETNYVLSFFSEAYRVLRKNGCLRISVPDSRFLYEMLLSKSDYFSWYGGSHSKKTDEDCFIELVASHRINIKNYGLNADLGSIEYDRLMAELRSDGIFDDSKPSRHINNFDFNRIKEIGKMNSFDMIFESKAGGSINSALQGRDMDRTHPEMSLYVDLLKI